MSKGRMQLLKGEEIIKSNTPNGISKKELRGIMIVVSS